MNDTSGRAKPKKEHKNDSDDDEDGDIVDLRQSQSVEQFARVRPGAYTLCDLDFNKDDEFIATATVAHSVRVYNVEQLSQNFMQNPDIETEPAVVLKVDPAFKLSSLRWNPEVSSMVVTADYGGGVTVFDAAQAKVVHKNNDHPKRVWSVDFSPVQTRMFATGSDDFSVKIFDVNTPNAVMTMMPYGRNVCAVRCHPTNEHYVAASCADHNVYLLDTRTGKAVSTLKAHKKSVAHLAFVSDNSLISAATDSTCIMWDLDSAKAVRTYVGHTNVRNFVGLALNPTKEYFAIGSETNEFFMYNVKHRSFVLHTSFPQERNDSGSSRDKPRLYGSCTAWMRNQNVLACGNSRGHLHLYRHITE